MTKSGRCARALNTLHSTLYFAPELGAEYARLGVPDDMAAYLACRTAPLGAVGPGAVAGLFAGFAPGMLARHLPALWSTIVPADALDARLRAADAALRRLLGDAVDSPEVVEAAKVANHAVAVCVQGGRPLGSSNALLPVPPEPHLALWHAATVLREYRGDGHVAVLSLAGLSSLEALVFDCASPLGMPAELVRAKRGWTAVDWAGAEARLGERGLLDAEGAPTARGTVLRDALESETDRLDRPPYDELGPAATERLAELASYLVDRCANGFPTVLRGFFVPTPTPTPTPTQ